MKKKIVSLLLALCMLLCLFGCARKPDVLELTIDTESSYSAMYGNLILRIPANAFLRHFQWGDIVSVEIGDGMVFEAPVCEAYDDVSVGELLLRAETGEDCVEFARCYGQMGIETGLMQRTEDAYVYLPGAEKVAVRISLREKGSYAGRLAIGQLEYSDRREDYDPDVTDEQFANFRAVSVAGILPDTLYRSSSPIDSFYGRNETADALARKAGIRFFVDLVDSEEQAKAHDAYADSYFSTQDSVCMAMPVAFTSDTFRQVLAEALRSLGGQEPPYLIFCTMGRDRTGLCCAMLELFAGAALDEVREEYAACYENYYRGLKKCPGQVTDAVHGQLCDMIEENLEAALGIDDLGSVDTAAAMADYFRSIGLSEAELTALRAAICG